MEQVLEREAKVPAGYEDIIIYDDNGNRVTNVVTLRAFKESEEIYQSWKKFLEDSDTDED